MSFIDELTASLKSLGRQTHQIDVGEGGRLLILPDGGRALGLFSGNDPSNFLWTNPDLSKAENAKKLYESEWLNAGGDRTWLSPEVELFIHDLKNPFVSHKVPVELDPGSYSVEIVDGNPHLTMIGRFRLIQAQTSVTIRIVKWFAQARDPLQSSSPMSDAISYAGYRSYTSVEMLEGSEHPGARVSLWSLLQLNHGGLAIVCTYGKIDPLVMFGKIAPADLEISSDSVGYFTRVVGANKISIPSVDATGRMGYIYRSHNGYWNLIVRNFSVFPSDRYIDTPFSDRSVEGSCIQICNYSVPAVRFTELEYHGPAIGFGTERLSYSDCCLTWAYRGLAPGISRLAGRLLGIAGGVMATRAMDTAVL